MYIYIHIYICMCVYICCTGNQTHVMASIPKLVGGLDGASTIAASALYQAAFDKVCVCERERER